MKKTDRIIFPSREDFLTTSEIRTENNGDKTCSVCTYLDTGLQLQGKNTIGTVKICTRLALREPGRKKAIPFITENGNSCKFWRVK